MVSSRSSSLLPARPRRPARATVSGLAVAGLALTAVLFQIGCQDNVGIGRVAGKVVSDPSIDFGNVQVGLLASVDFEVKNQGNVGVRITSVATSTSISAAAYEFKVAEHAFLIPAQDKKVLRVTFQPFQEMAEPVQSSFTLITDMQNEDGSPLKVRVGVKGRGVKSGLIVEPNPVEFGGVLIGASRTMDVKITNALSVPVDVISEIGADGKATITTQGGHGTFEIVSPIYAQGSLLMPDTKLDPGAAVTVQARYTPDPTEVNRADFGRWVISNCVSELCKVEVRMSGHGTNTGIECSPSAVDFGDINPGRVATRTITCTNVSTGDIALTNWGLSAASAGEFSVTPFPSPAPVVHPGDTFPVEASFSPGRATLGQHVTGTLAITSRSDSAMRALDPVQIQLAGSGGGPTIGVSPMQLDFGQVGLGTTNTKRLLVTNSGYSDLVVTAVAPQGSDATLFMPSLDAFTLATGTATVVEVTFAPTVEAPAAADLVFDSNDGSNPHLTVPMHGIGLTLPPCNYTVTPASLAYGVVPVRQTAHQTVRIQNQGTDECLVSGLEITGDPDFSLVNGTVASTRVAGGASLDVPIDFVPEHAGSRSASLGFYISSAGASNPTVPLFGVGFAQTDVMCPPPVTTPAGVPVTLTLATTTMGTTITSIDWAITSAPTGGIGTPGQWVPSPPTRTTETFLPYIVGAYTIHVTVTDNLGNTASCETQVTAEGHGLRVQLTWDGSGDVDLHVHDQNSTPWFNQGGGTDDCYYAERTPIWNAGQAPATGENPQLDFDNVTANGPENTRVDTVVVGQAYTVGVHNYARAAGRIATVDIFCGGVTTPTQTFVSAPLNGATGGDCSDNDFWKVATVVFTSQTSCTVTPINTVGPSSTYCTMF